MTMISIHQPMYLPYPGIFNKIKNSDIFVFLDDAQYTRTYFYNRNKVKSPHGELMITVPIIKKHEQNLNEVRISQNVNWQGQHLKTLEHMYNKSDHFKDHKDYFENIYKKKWEFLNDLNIETMTHIMEELKIDVPIYFSSKLLQNVELKSTERLIALCQKVGGDCYLSGIGGENYMDKKLFEKEGIKLVYQSYITKEYKQLYPPFISNLSIVDLLFNMGKKARDFI